MKNKLRIIIALFAALCISFSAEAQKIESMKGSFLLGGRINLPTEIEFEYNTKGLISKVSAFVIVDEELSNFFLNYYLTIDPGIHLMYYYKYDYNANGEIADFEAWDLFRNYNQLSEKFTYIYTEEGWVESKIGYEIYDDGSICPNDKTEYTYDAAGNETGRFEFYYDEEASEGNEWYPDSKREMLIDPEDNTKWTLKSQFYYDFLGDWDAPSYTYYTMQFNDKGLIEEKSEYEDEERLNLISTDEYEYNDEGKPIWIKYFNQTWSSYSIQTIQYPAYGLPKLLHKGFMGENSMYNRFWTSYNADWTTIKSESGYNTVFSDFDDKGCPQKAEVIYTRRNEYTDMVNTIADFAITYHNPSGIDPVVEMNSSIWAENGKLVVETDKISFLLVYDLSGRVFVKQHIASGTTRHSLPSGSYIVVVDNISRKIQL